ncbi:MAG: hypothetical protein M1821_000266 [Bathelium mastoideum]|nr:MAG: hypothetical protein M1821_000266 [Bathelium mastoideum]
MASTTPPLSITGQSTEWTTAGKGDGIFSHARDTSEREKHEQDPSPSRNNSQQEPDKVDQPAPAAPPAIQEQQWVSGFKLLTIMAAIVLPCFLLLLDTSIVVTAIPLITNDFHSLPDVGWYGSAYMISSAVLQPLTGKFYKNFNSKWTFMTFFALFELGSLICGISTSSKMLIVGRAIAGMGTSGILNGAFTIIARCVPMPRRPALIGLATGLSQLGLVIGPLIGGVLTEYASWRWCFYINLPIGGLVAILIAFVHVPDQVPKLPVLLVVRTLPAKLDLIGFALFAPAAIQLLLALQYGGNTFAWKSAQIIGLFCGAGGTFILFMAWDYCKGEAAMIPFSMVRKRPVWSSCLTYGFLMGQIFCVSYYLPIYFQGVKGVSPTMSGVYILPIVSTHVFFALTSGKLVGRVGYYLPFIVAGSVLVTIANGLLSTLSPETSTGIWAGYQIMAGAGRGLGLTIVRLFFPLQKNATAHYRSVVVLQPIIAVQNTLPPAQIPVAMALVMFSQSFGGALFLSFCDTIFTNSLKTLVPKYAPSVDPEVIINAGATGFRTVISKVQQTGVLVAYSKVVDRVFYFTTGLAAASFAFCWFMGFNDIRKKNQVSKA